MPSTKNQRGDISTTGDEIVLKSAANKTTIAATSTTDRTVSLPDATDTLVGRDTTDTLTNKRLTSPKLNEDVVVTTTATQANYLSGATGSTGTGNIVFDDSPTLITPTLGVASATSLNKLTFTEPATGATVTIQDGKTFQVDRSLTLTGNDSQTLDLGTSLTVNTGTVVLRGDAGGSDVTLPASGTLATSSGTLTDATIESAVSITVDAGSTIDADGAGTLSIGGTDATTLNLGRTGQTQALLGDATVAGTLDVTGTTTLAEATSTELGYLSGVSSSIQTQLNGKEPTISTGTTAQYIRGDKSLSDLATDVAATAAVTANTAKVSATGSIDTHSDVDTTSVAPATGDVLTFDGSNWVPDTGGAGSGEVNFNLNPNAVSALDNSVANDIGDWISTSPSNGAFANRVTTTSIIPRYPFQTTGIQIVNDSPLVSDHVRLRFQVPPADRGKKLKIEWAQFVGTSYESGDLEVELYSYSDAYSTGETEVTLSGGNSIPAQTGVYYNEFDSDDREYYEMRIVQAVAGGLADDYIVLNDVIIGPGKLHSGGIVTAWEPWTPTGTWTTNTTYTGYKRRVGENVEAYVQVLLSGAPNSAALSINLPTDHTINTDVIINTETLTQELGYIVIHDNAPANYKGILRYNSSTSLRASYTTDVNNLLASVTETGPFTFAANDKVTAYFNLPIEEFRGSGVLNVINQDNTSEWKTYDASVSGMGSPTSELFKWRRDSGDMLIRGKVVMSSTVPTTTLSFQVPSGFTIDYTRTVSSSSDEVVGYAYADDGGSGTGVHGGRVRTTTGSPTTTFLIAGDDGTGIWNASAPFTWANGDVLQVDVRVPIVEFSGSQSSLVGFSHATEDQHGLVKRNKWQRVQLAQDVTATASDVSATTGNSAFSFSNLVIGKTYLVTAQAALQVSGTSGTEIANFNIVHDSVAVGSARLRGDKTTAGNFEQTAQARAMFVATASTVTFAFSLAGTATLRGNNDYLETWAMIEELDNYGAESSDF